MNPRTPEKNKQSRLRLLALVATSLLFGCGPHPSQAPAQTTNVIVKEEKVVVIFNEKPTSELQNRQTNNCIPDDGCKIEVDFVNPSPIAQP